MDLSTWEEDYANGADADMDRFTEHLVSSPSPNTVVIDCSASDTVASYYKGWLQKGLHVVTPNKKANSGDLKYYKELRDIQRNSYTVRRCRLTPC